jgi:hypothetical protein
MPLLRLLKRTLKARRQRPEQPIAQNTKLKATKLDAKSCKYENLNIDFSALSFLPSAFSIFKEWQ